MKICLVMIVKDESHVFRRCLESVIDLVDRVMVVDTGSSRDQYFTMRDVLIDVGSSLEDTDHWHMPIMEWVNFAHNRSEAIKLAEKHWPEIEYILTIDADDYVLSGLIPEILDKDGYYVNLVSESVDYQRVQIFKTGIGWHYRGVVHEYPDTPNSHTLGAVSLKIASTRDGSRSRNPDKYRMDAELLASAIYRGDDPDLLPRYTFYLAQSYRDAGDTKRAFACYLARTDMNGYIDEIYYSFYQAARMLHLSGAPVDDVVTLCKEAQRHNLARHEAVWFAAKLLREAKRYADAYRLLRVHPLIMPMPTGLFIERDVYLWRYWDELSVSAYYAGEAEVSLRAALRAVKGYPNKSLDMERLTANLAFSTKLAERQRNGPGSYNDV